MFDIKGVFEALIVTGIVIGIVSYLLIKFIFSHVSIILH